MPLPLGLVLIVDRASQYKVDGRSRLYSGRCSVATITLLGAGVVLVAWVGSRMNLLRCAAQINHELQVLALIRFMAMVLVVVTP